MASDVDIDPEFDDDDDDNNHSGDINFDILRSDCKYITEGQIKDFFCLTDQASLNFLHINCRSLKKNFGPITNLLNFLSGPLSAIMVTETWLSESLQDVFTIQGYNFFLNLGVISLEVELVYMSMPLLIAKFVWTSVT
jgi:hypothetical protein